MTQDSVLRGQGSPSTLCRAQSRVSERDYGRGADKFPEDAPIPSCTCTLHKMQQGLRPALPPPHAVFALTPNMLTYLRVLVLIKPHLCVFIHRKCYSYMLIRIIFLHAYLDQILVSYLNKTYMTIH